MALATPVVSAPVLPAEWTEVRTTSKGRPITWYVDEQVHNGNWTLEVISAEVVGLSRPITVFRAPRHTNLVTYDWHGDDETFCPPMWWDLAIGSGACGWGNTKNGIKGVYHHVSPKYLQNYMNEYGFRYSHRNDMAPMFLTILKHSGAKIV